MKRFSKTISKLFLPILVLCLTSCSNQDQPSEPQTNVVTIEQDIVKVNENGELVDGATGETLSSEQIRELNQSGVISIDNTGTITVDPDKNKQSVEVITSNDGKVISAKDDSGKSVKLSEQTVHDVSKTVAEQKANNDKTTSTSGFTQPTEEPTASKPSGTTEKVTEKPAERPTEKITEKPTEAPTEQLTEKPTEKPTEAPTEKPTEVPTEKPTEKPTERVTEKPTETPTEKPTEAPKACSHDWVWKTHTEKVHHDAVYEDQPVYSEEWKEPVYVYKIRCNICESYYPDNETYANEDPCLGSHSRVRVIDHYIIHEPEFMYMLPTLVSDAYDETVTVNDYQYCSICGEKK